jgi:SAM-dependent methyltransferase
VPQSRGQSVHASISAAMGLRADEREWNDLAARDAMWAVCSLPELRGRWTAEEFFDTGEREVAGVMGGLEAAGLAPARRHRALDFGCGVGRLTRALSTRFDEVVGVDLSDRMVEEARRANADRTNCRFIANSQPALSFLPTAGFDFVLSLIALQHVSSRRAISSYIREFVRVTAPGGVIAFQLPTKVSRRLRLHPLRVTNRIVRKLPWFPDAGLHALMPHSMALNDLSESQVRRLLTDAGAKVETAFPDGRTGTSVASSNFYVARIPAT